MKFKKQHWFYIATFLLGIVLLAVYWVLGANTFTAFLAKEIGFALIVAIILIYTVESVSRQTHETAASELMDNINKNIFKAVYKRYIPESVFQEVEDCLLNCDVVRNDYCIDYTLSELTAEQASKSLHGRHLSCSIFSSYKLKNVKNTDIQQSIQFSIETAIDKEFASDTSILQISIDGRQLSSEDIQNHSKITGSEVKFTYPVTIGPRGVIDISMEGITIKRDTDAEIFSSKLPSNSVELRIYTPDDIVVNAKANNSKSLSTVKSSNNLMHWELKGGLFPHQSLIFWWQKKE